MKYTFCIFIILLTHKVYPQDKENIYQSNYIDILYGVAYEPEDYNSIGHPFFLDDKIYKANLWFEGSKISNVFVKYDLYLQTLVLYQDFNSTQYRFIKINTKGVQKLEIIDNNKVYNLQPYWEIPELSEKIAYYELIYSNKVKFLVGRQKILNELAVDNKNKFFEQEMNYFIINNNCYEIKNKKDILKLFPDYKDELKSHIRKNKLKIKLTNKDDVVRLITYYEYLSTKQ